METVVIYPCARHPGRAHQYLPTLQLNPLHPPLYETHTQLSALPPLPLTFLTTKMKKYVLLSLLMTITAAITCQAKNRAQEIIDEIHNPESDKVLVAVHRGDWRNHPENSIPAIKSAIEMGADIVELDVALTADSVLVLCHDRTVDRTATGSGAVSDLTLEQIRSLRLYAGHRAQATELLMPTLREAMELCKDRIVINIDKGYEYYDPVSYTHLTLPTKLEV